MPRKLFLEIANFTLRFGNEFVLLDLLEEIVIPAFVGPYERPTRGSTILFHNVKLLDAGIDANPMPVIAGRVVKLTKVQRFRTFDRDRGLIDDTVELDSSPASFFVLVLDGHRLLYVREESESPGIVAFGNTIQKFLDNSYIEYINSLHDEELAKAKQTEESTGQRLSGNERTP